MKSGEDEKCKFFSSVHLKRLCTILDTVLLLSRMCPVTSIEIDTLLHTHELELANGLDERLYEVVKTWLAEDWPFEKVAYPGRNITWAAWDKLEDIT